MNAHTPGTWSYYQNTESTYLIVPTKALERLELEGVEIGEVFIRKNIKSPEANARLISAAPEMYSALVFAVEIMSASAQFLAERGFDMITLTV